MSGGRAGFLPCCQEHSLTLAPVNQSASHFVTLCAHVKFYTLCHTFQQVLDPKWTHKKIKRIVYI